MKEPNPREEAIFSEALKLPPEAQAGFLQKECAGNASLQASIEALLEAHGQRTGPLEQVTASPKKKDPYLSLAEEPGEQIGRYRLLQKIGEGGWGVVYMAEQLEPVKRRVALKVIKPSMHCEEMLGRFEAERQALALMDHANIAKVLDAGATRSGRPFFVMELIRGIKITDYCDQNNVPTGQRLELFIQICRAVQHAHQKGIIHRDIKPSNILVTLQEDGTPTPKIIDFGIAKAAAGQVLTDKTVFTAFEQFIGTPAYMSPEQAEMMTVDIDTRSDIYSLGVLLYELLTGKTPFDARALVEAGLDEVRRIIREEEPPRPSTRLSTLNPEEQSTAARRRQSEPPKLIHLVRGDLDWIVMKCLEKDRTRRYDTANGLAMDIERHLRSEPIVARPPSNVYRLQKLVRRNKLAFAATAAIAAALVAGLAISAWGLIREQKARLRAEANEKKAQQVATFMNDMLKHVGPSAAAGRDTTLLHEVLNQTAGRVSVALTNQPEVEAELRYTLGEVYRDVGDMDKAEMMHKRALELRMASVGAGHPTTAVSMSHLGRVLLGKRRFPEAEATLRDALKVQRSARGVAPSDLAFTLNELSVALNAQGSKPQRAEAEALLREALTSEKLLFGEESPEVAATLDHLAEVLRYVARGMDLAEPVAREALIARKKHPEDQTGLAGTLGLLALVIRQGKGIEAETLARQALSIDAELAAQERAAIAQATTNQIRRESKRIARRMNDLGLILSDAGKSDEAENALKEAVELRRRSLGGEDGIAAQRDLAESLNALAILEEKRKKLSEAESLFREALDIHKTYISTNDAGFQLQLHYLGRTLVKEKKWKEAEPVVREAIATLERIYGSAADPSSSVANLVQCLEAQGRPAEAETLLTETIARRKTTAVGSRDVGPVLYQLANLLTSQGRFSEAIPLLREGAELGGSGAQNDLGWAYHIGQGVATNDLEAVKLWTKAAERGNRWAQDNLAWMYLNGIGTNTNLSEALRLYRLAANQGHIPAELNLAECYERGTGVEKDTAEAAKWYRKAGEQALAADRYDIEGLNASSWFLATCQDSQVRDGSNAVRFAEAAVARTRQKKCRCTGYTGRSVRRGRRIQQSGCHPKRGYPAFEEGGRKRGLCSPTQAIRVRQTLSPG